MVFWYNFLSFCHTGFQTLVWNFYTFFEDVPKNHAIVPVWKQSQSFGVYDEEKGIWTGMVGEVSNAFKIRSFTFRV